MNTATSCVVEQLARRAETHAHELAWVFMPRREPAIELTWATLNGRARQLAGALVGAGVRPGQVTFVLSASPYEQALGFLGALAAGAVPSILSFPSVKQSRERFFETLEPIVHSTGARWILSSNELADTVKLGELPARVITFPTADGPTRVEPVQLPPPGQSFLQFSSGTTGLRKCVRITSAMLVSQVSAYASALELTRDDRIASWLPLYHDMGLIAAFLMPLFHGNMAVHLSPFDWLKEPAFFLKAVSTYRATLAWMPNFAYTVTAAQVTDEDVANVDLRSIRAFVNCSEPVRASAHEKFLARFAAAGIRADHLQASYAMAETTFATTQTPLGRPARIDRVDSVAFTSSHRAVPAEAGAPSRAVATFVSSGRPVADAEVRIDGASNEREIGEIAVRGTSLFAGYGVEGDKRDSFSDDGWYQTGDLGYLADGELFVTGRAKDLIIQRGSNVYPADVEEAFGAIPGIRPGRAVVFGVFDESEGTEQIVAMVEVEEGHDATDLERRVREEVWAQLSLALSDIRVCGAGALIKSTSGKLSRSANRELYLQAPASSASAGRSRPRSTHSEAYAAPRDLWERQLAWLWEEVLEIAPIGIDDNLFLDLAADSLSTTRVASEIRRRWQRDVRYSALLGADTVRRQADLLRRDDLRTEPLLTLQRKGTGRGFFLVHAAGGWAFPYVSLARQMGTERPVHAFQAPQLHDGDVEVMSVESIADSYLGALRKVQPRGPYCLAGWSFGGYVAFEMANRLRAEGETVAKLVLFDTAPPASTRERVKSWLLHTALGVAFRASLRAPQLQRHVAALRQVGEMAPVWRFFTACHLGADNRGIGPLLKFAFRERCDPSRIAHASEEALWGYLVELANQRPTPEEQVLLVPGIDGHGARRAMEVSRTLERLNAFYSSSRKYDGTIDIFAVRGNDQLLRWQDCSTRPLRMHWFDIQKLLVGPHFDMMEAENVKLFAPTLRQLLTEADEVVTRGVSPVEVCA